jgi:hypothetical protein
MARKKNPAAVALGRLGGKVKVRKGIATLTEGERKALAARANKIRWAKEKKQP